MQTFAVIFLLLILAAAGAAARKLTLPAALAGWCCGLLVYLGAGLPGLLMLFCFFLLGTAATAWQKDRKRLPGTHAEHQSKRNTGQVLANGGVAALTGVLAFFLPHLRILLTAMMAGSLASATADTLSSELGMVYGRRCYDVLSLKPSPPGPDGVVSLEGTLAGVAGAAFIAAIFTWTPSGHMDVMQAGGRFGAVLAAGILGNLTDSVLGATLERQGRIGNDMVNFLNTVTGALAAGLLILPVHNMPK